MTYLFILISFLLSACTNNQLVNESNSTMANPSPTSTPETISSPPSSVSASPSTPAKISDTVILKTSKGDIVLKLYTKDAPNTVKNFQTKINSKFYNQLNFHRVEDWVIQGGDPSGNGTGGGKMPAEYNQIKFKTGSLGVARGMDKQINNDSQFFICTTDCDFLTNNYTNFGEVISGMEVVNQIAIGDKIIELSYK